MLWELAFINMRLDGYFKFIFSSNLPILECLISTFALISDLSVLVISFLVPRRVTFINLGSTSKALFFDEARLHFALEDAKSELIDIS